MNPIAMKIVLFNEKVESLHHHNNFYSLYKDGKIVGTQWIPVDDRIGNVYEKHEVFYQL